jgi:tRNA (Thr-GGU) A37 N-methylase
VLLTWCDRARRDVLATRPRDDPANPELGVFSTRSPTAQPDRPAPGADPRPRRPSPAGGPLEALDGTPIVDVKPCSDRRR